MRKLKILGLVLFPEKHINFKSCFSVQLVKYLQALCLPGVSCLKLWRSMFHIGDHSVDMQQTITDLYTQDRTIINRSTGLHGFASKERQFCPFPAGCCVSTTLWLLPGQAKEIVDMKCLLWY